MLKLSNRSDQSPTHVAQAVHRATTLGVRPFSSKNSLVKFEKTQAPEARGRELGDVTVTGTKSTTQGRGGAELCWFRVAMKP